MPKYWLREEKPQVGAMHGPVCKSVAKATQVRILDLPPARQQVSEQRKRDRRLAFCSELPARVGAGRAIRRDCPAPRCALLAINRLMLSLSAGTLLAPARRSGDISSLALGGEVCLRLARTTVEDRRPGGADRRVVRFTGARAARVTFSPVPHAMSQLISGVDGWQGGPRRRRSRGLR